MLLRLWLIITVLCLVVSCKHKDSGASKDNNDPVYKSLVRITVEAPGENCVYGGQKIETGLDA